LTLILVKLPYWFRNQVNHHKQYGGFMITDIFDSTRMNAPLVLVQEGNGIPDIFLPLVPIDPDADGLGGWLP
jgi:hypothetical protein